MRNPPALTGWDTAVSAYLSSRHAFGRAYRKEEYVLKNMRAFLARHHAKDLDQSLFDQWRSQYYHRSTSTRIVYEFAIYNFCRYRRRNEPRCYLPDRFALARSRPHPLPTLVEHDQVVRLLHYVSTRQPRPQGPWLPAVLRLAIVLLYTAGLRRGEVARLTLEDVDARAGVLRIREAKVHKSRWVPLSRSAAGELHRYLEIRHTIDAHPDTLTPLLCTPRGVSYSGGGLSL